MKARRSSALADTPDTLTEPSVERITLPFARISKASTSSPEVVRPTSEPSKYMLNAPLVVGPSEVASKRTTSESSIVPATPERVAPSESSENSSESASSQPNTSIRRLASPTSEPSKAMLNVEFPSNETTSSLATATPPTVPSFRRVK